MTETNQLIGRSVRLLAGDILGTSVNAVIRKADRNLKSLLLEFAQPVKIDARTYPLAVVQPRLQSEDLDTLLEDGSLGCAFTCVSDDHYDPEKPFDLSWWHGGAAAIADLILI